MARIDRRRHLADDMMSWVNRGMYGLRFRDIFILFYRVADGRLGAASRGVVSVKDSVKNTVKNPIKNAIVFCAFLNRFSFSF